MTMIQNTSTGTSPSSSPSSSPSTTATNNSNTNNNNNNRQPYANKRERLWLYDSKAQALLQKAHEQAVLKQKQEDAAANRIYPVVRTYDEDYDYDQLSLPSEGEAEEEEEGERASSSSSTSSSEEEDPQQSSQQQEKDSGNYSLEQPTKPTKPPKANKKKEMTPKQTKRLQQEMLQQYSNLIKTSVPITINEEEEAVAAQVNAGEDTTTTTFAPPYNLQLPSALLSKSEQQYGTPVSKAKAYVDLSTQLCTNSTNGTNGSAGSGYVVVLLLQSGKFAGGVFQGATCKQHKTMQKYTVRKGQGKAQSAQDGKRRPKSMGSQLRRQGELQLKEDIQTLLWKDWKIYLEKASLILISCPKTMLSTLLDAPTGPQWSSLNSSSSSSKKQQQQQQQPKHQSQTPPTIILSRKDTRIRKIPMNVGRPTYESVYMVHQVLLQVSLEPTVVATTTTTGDEDGDAVSEPVDTTTDNNKNKDGSKSQSQSPPKEEEKPDETIPLLHLHHLCQAGNHAQVLDWLQTSDAAVEASINQQAGVDFMTPLHYAAGSCATRTGTTTTTSTFASTSTAAGTKNDSSPLPLPLPPPPPPLPQDAAACVYDLLTRGKADPTMLDARLRPPYFCAGHDKVREAFRKARAVLGEDHCNWKAAQVGPPLSDEVLEQKKSKEAEKRRRKKLKAKEKKLKEKQAQEEAAAKQEKEKAKQKAEEKATGRNCACCQKAIRGRKNIFKRLEFEYCSSKCVNDHKRELMASAALARFG